MLLQSCNRCLSTSKLMIRLSWLTIARSNEEVVDERGTTTDRERLKQVKLVIVVFKENFEILICEEVASV